MSRSRHKQILDPVEQRIADAMNRSLEAVAEERARRAQQNVFQRLAEEILLFKKPLALLGFGAIIFVLYRYVNVTAAKVVSAMAIVVVGLGLLYAAYFTFTLALWGSDHDVWQGNWAFRQRYPFKGEVVIERFGLLVGTLVYLMFGLLAFVIAWSLVTRT